VLQFVGFQPTEGKGETGEGGGRGAEGEDGEATTSVALFRLLPWPGRNFGPGAPTSTNTQTGDWWELLRIDVVLDVHDAVLAVAGLHTGYAYGLYLQKTSSFKSAQRGHVEYRKSRFMAHHLAAR
jgi:hypothetical protein